MPTRFTHTCLIANDWKKLSAFYQDVFGCVPVPPERDMSGDWLDRGTGVRDAHITGMHLRLPGHGDAGPTLELFQYDTMPQHPEIRPNTPGFSHIAFAVDDVPSTARLFLEHGGSEVGELTVREVPGVGQLTFQYLADPEGNIVELQNRKESGT
jgi:catechol 2,3-dioxygenase-like lactoylglutathione lyase family enzyme